MKRFITFLVMTVFLFTIGPGIAEANSVTIFYNGEVLNTKEPVFIDNGRTLIPMRDYFNAIGVEVEWDQLFRRATVRYPGKIIVLKPDEGKIWINGVEQLLDVGPKVINDRIYVPLRFLSQNMGYVTDYKDSAVGKLIYIYGGNRTPDPSTEGDMLKIFRKTPELDTSKIDPNTRNSAYYQWVNSDRLHMVLENGNLIEVASLGDVLEIRNIDKNTGEYTSKETNTGNKFTYLNSVDLRDNEFLVIYNQLEYPSHYVGIGEPISTSREIRQISTQTGDYRAYNSRADYSSLTIDGKEGNLTGLGKDTQRGYCLDAKASTYKNFNGSYAQGKDGSHCFNINDQVIVVNKDIELEFEDNYNKDVQKSIVKSFDNKFFIFHLVRENNFTNRLYSLVVDDRGRILQRYDLLKVFDDEDNLRIDDCVLDGNRILLLLKTDGGRYLGTYNTKDYSYNISEIAASERFNKLIPSASGYYLFGQDPDYFYLAPVK